MGSVAARFNIVIVFLCLFSAIEEALSLETFSRQYGQPFDDTYYDIFQVEPQATISNRALQVTPDSASEDFNKTYNSGRILLRRSFRLWDGDIAANTSRVASFNSSFLINVYRPNNATPGEGLAFLIAPDLERPANSYGEYLGLTNSSTDGNASNHLVAIELDTFKQDFDPDGNHIGLDINGVRSKTTVSLTPLGIEIAPVGAKFYNLWVQYDGVNKSVEVYIAEQASRDGPTPPRPTSPVLISDLDLRTVVNRDSYFGFSASTGNTTQLNCVLRWNFTIQYFPDNNRPWLKIVLGAGVPILVLLLLGAAALHYYRRKNQSARTDSNILGALKSLPGMPREFEFRDLKKATNNFEEKNKLGQGGYGVVYRGILPKENLDIAVKCFLRESIKGQDDFLAELTIINRLRHKHLVRLLGWCHKNGKLVLVYDYMPNGSLDKHLFATPGATFEPLSWILRHKIVAGVASALHYLHNEYDQRVVHRDIKASNVMLDADFNARLGDFGLARALEHDKTSYAEAEGVLGTIGYIAPECFHTGKATQQSDIYAFGAVVLEIVCGLRPGTTIGGFQFLVDWVWALHREGQIMDAVDPRLEGEFVLEEAERLLKLGLACSHPMASERPKTQTVVQVLSGMVAAPGVPRFKPAFVWPAMVVDMDSSTVETTSITTSRLGSGIWSAQYISRESFVDNSDLKYSSV